MKFLEAVKGRTDFMSNFEVRNKQNEKIDQDIRKEANGYKKEEINHALEEKTQEKKIC